MEKKNKPVAVFRAGGISATVWANEAEKNGARVTMHSVQVERTYKVGEEYKTTSSFGVQDLPRVELVAARAFEWLVLKVAESGPQPG